MTVRELIKQLKALQDLDRRVCVCTYSLDADGDRDNLRWCEIEGVEDDGPKPDDGREYFGVWFHDPEDRVMPVGNAMTHDDGIKDAIDEALIKAGYDPRKPEEMN